MTHHCMVWYTINVRPSAMQCVLAVKETLVIKPSRLVKSSDIRPLQFPPPFPPLALIHTTLSLSLKKKDVALQHLHLTHVVSLMVLRNTTLVPPLRSCIGPART